MSNTEESVEAPPQLTSNITARLAYITQSVLGQDEDYEIKITSNRSNKKGETEFTGTVTQMIGGEPYKHGFTAVVKAPTFEHLVDKLEKAVKKSRRSRAQLVSSLFR